MRTKILLAPDGQDGGKGAATTAKETPEQIIARLEARVAELEASQKKASEREVQIRQKMEHGLSREQAISVLDRQEQHDAAKAKAKAAAATQAKTKPSK